MVLCGISCPFGQLSPARGEITHVLLTRAPLYSSRRTFAYDLHVLSPPLTFALSQDQTLQLKLRAFAPDSCPLIRDNQPKSDARGITEQSVARIRLAIPYKLGRTTEPDDRDPFYAESSDSVFKDRPETPRREPQRVHPVALPVSGGLESVADSASRVKRFFSRCGRPAAPPGNRSFTRPEPRVRSRRQRPVRVRRVGRPDFSRGRRGVKNFFARLADSLEGENRARSARITGPIDAPEAYVVPIQCQPRRGPGTRPGLAPGGAPRRGGRSLALAAGDATPVEPSDVFFFAWAQPSCRTDVISPSLSPRWADARRSTAISWVVSGFPHAWVGTHRNHGGPS